ncbi:argininosuccinate synthase, partial [Candidatus Omnitrophota bacterium]
LDAFFAEHQDRVNGKVRLRLEKGTMSIVGRQAKKSLYKEKLATYSADDEFDHTAANGFIKLWGLPYEGTR